MRPIHQALRRLAITVKQSFAARIYPELIQVASLGKTRMFSFVRFMWKGDSGEEKKPVSHWFHFGLQAVVGACLLYWHWNPPPPNKAVLALAACAALMVFAAMRPIHKAIYFVLIVMLVLTESHAIDKDRRDFALDEASRREQENTKFQAIANGIQGAITDSDTNFKATMDSVNNATNMVTGGDTFCYLSLEPALNGFGMDIIKVGKYPLRFRRVTIENQTMFGEEMQKLQPGIRAGTLDAFVAMSQAGQLSEAHIQIPDFATDSTFMGSFPYPSSGEELNLNIVFNAFNGIWVEYYSAKKVNGKWRQAIYVDTGELRRPEWYKKIDPGFPVDAQGLVPGWPHPVTKR